MIYTITQASINDYTLTLLSDERAAGTIQKYRRDLTAFARWLGGRCVTKENAALWKAHLLEQGYKPTSINAMSSFRHTWTC